MAFPVAPFPGITPNQGMQSMFDAQNQYNESVQDRMKNQKMREAMPFNIPTLEAELMRTLLGNEQAKMTNQMTSESLPYNKQMIEANLMKTMLGNQQTQQEMQLGPEEFALKKAMLAHQMRKLQQESMPQQFDLLRDSSGVAQQVAIADLLESQGKTEQARLIRESIGGSSGLNEWRSIPQSNRRDLIAAARGLGFDEREAVSLFAKGNSLSDLAESKGIPRETLTEYERIYGPSPQAINSAQQRQAAEVELDYLGNRFTQMIEPYVDPFAIGGFSASQVVDAVKGQNEDQQANFLAGTILYKDLAMLRNRLGMGENGITAIQEMEKASLGNITPFTKLVTPTVFRKMNEIVNKELKTASQLANQAIFNPEVLAEERREAKGKSSSSKSIDDMNEEETMKFIYGTD